MKRSASVNSFFSRQLLEQPNPSAQIISNAANAEASTLEPLSINIFYQPDDETSTSLCAHVDVPSRLTHDVLRSQRERKENVEKAIALADEQLTFMTQLISCNDEERIRRDGCGPVDCSGMNLFAEVTLLRTECKALCDDLEKLRPPQPARWSWFGCLTTSEVDGKDATAYGSGFGSNANSAWPCAGCSRTNEPASNFCSSCNQVRSKDV
uniref:RanBP2-type domain-containing protein n=1 Tax=Trichuris muris TaxID=70415 RepID=A0A5S6QD15_TRIMR